MMTTADRVARHCLQHVQVRRDAISWGQESVKALVGRSVDRVKDCVSAPVASIYEPCPWLDESASEVNASATGRDLPFYLWDIRGQRTIETSKIAASDAVYAIISHTWGRWRTHGLGQGAKIPGVPWPVPENTLFDVKSLPTMLQNAGFVELYVWLDLLCIPQDPYDSSKAPITQQEVARQAVIFKNASTPVCWLNYVSGWDNLKISILWMGLQYLRVSTYPGHKSGQKFKQANSAANYVEDILPINTAFPQQPYWFSSIWTLQESLMRPDVIFVNKDWHPLVIRDNFPLALGDLVTLAFPPTQIDEKPGHHSGDVHYVEDAELDPLAVLGLKELIEGVG